MSSLLDQALRGTRASPRHIQRWRKEVGKGYEPLPEIQQMLFGYAYDTQWDWNAKRFEENIWRMNLNHDDATQLAYDIHNCKDIRVEQWRTEMVLKTCSNGNKDCFGCFIYVLEAPSWPEACHRLDCRLSPGCCSCAKPITTESLEKTRKATRKRRRNQHRQSI